MEYRRKRWKSFVFLTVSLETESFARGNELAGFRVDRQNDPSVHKCNCIAISDRSYRFEGNAGEWVGHASCIIGHFELFIANRLFYAQTTYTYRRWNIRLNDIYLCRYFDENTITSINVIGIKRTERRVIKATFPTRVNIIKFAVFGWNLHTPNKWLCIFITSINFPNDVKLFGIAVGFISLILINGDDADEITW